VWLDTPRGMLGGCWKCGEKSMRSCQCYQDREVNDYNSKGLDAFQNQEAHVSNPTEHVIGKHGHRHHANSLRADQGSFKRSEQDQARSYSRASSSAALGGYEQQASMSVDYSSQGQTHAMQMLVNLKSFKDRGLIDEDEYKASKAKIINSVVEPGNAEGIQRASSTMGFPSTTNQRTYQNPRSIVEGGKTLRNAQAARGRGEDAPVTASSFSSVEEEEEPGFPGVKRVYLDFLFKQLRQICYRKVRGNGNDVSIREIFRHFDSEKHGDAPGVDQEEFVQAVQRLMLGSAENGIISTEEAAALFARIDADHSGTIDYRETAATLSLPGWDNKVLGKKSNILL